MKYATIIITILVLFSACIGDDILQDTVAEQLRITNNIDTLAVGTTYQFEFRYSDNTGRDGMTDVDWSSSDPNILTISENGLATAVDKGNVQVTAAATALDGSTLTDTHTLTISDRTVIMEVVRTGTIAVTSNYILEGTFELREDGDELVLVFEDDYRASESLPGLYVYLTNNPNSTVDAFEIGKAPKEGGAHEFRFSGVEINDFDYLLYFCKPFGVKVGGGDIN